MELTIEDYLKAQEIVKNYRGCGNGGHGCGKLFKVEETVRTIQYGQEYHWCESCYEKIKDDY